VVKEQLSDMNVTERELYNAFTVGKARDDIERRYEQLRADIYSHIRTLQRKRDELDDELNAMHDELYEAGMQREIELDTFDQRQSA